MATYIRIDTPTKEQELVNLITAIMNHDQDLGSESPLPAQFMAEWSEYMGEYVKLQNRIASLREQLGSLVERKKSMQKAPSGKESKEQTVKQRMKQMRKLLQSLYMGKERGLEKWGFSVVKNHVPASKLGYNAHSKVKAKREAAAANQAEPPKKKKKGDSSGSDRKL